MHYSTAQEVWYRAGWCEVLLADIELVGDVEVVGASRCSTTNWLFDSAQAAPGTSICEPSTSLNREGGPQGTRWHPACCWLWLSGRADAAGFIGCVRYRQPRHASPSSSCIVWPWRGCHRLVYLISWWSHAACSLWPEQVENSTGTVRRSVGIGPRADTISAIHGRSKHVWSKLGFSIRIFLRTTHKYTVSAVLVHGWSAGAFIRLRQLCCIVDGRKYSTGASAEAPASVEFIKDSASAE